MRPQACLLENTRFHAGDTANDPAFAAALGSLADVYVCDAFGVVHRDQGSVTVCARPGVFFVPSWPGCKWWEGWHVGHWGQWVGCTR